MSRNRLTLICVVVTVVFLGAVGPAFATGRWSAAQQLDHSGAGLAGSYLADCASDTLCVGASGATGAQVAYHLPAGGRPASALEFGPIDPFDDKTSIDLVALQCPGASECLGVTDLSDGEDADDLDVIASTNPAAGPSSWGDQGLSDSNAPTALSCPTTSFCAGPGLESTLVTSDHPLGGSADWKTTNLRAQIEEVTCSSAAFCAAFDSNGDVWTSTDPSGGSAAWVKSGARAPLVSDANVDANGGNGDTGYNLPQFLGCTGPNLCVGAGPSGTVLVSTDPAGSAPWTPVRATPAGITAIACEPGTTVCLAGDIDGDVATSDDAAAASWTSVLTSAGSNAIVDLSCTGSTCIASPGGDDDVGGAPLLATVPAGGAAWQWNALDVTTYDAVSSIACPSARECIGVDQFRPGDRSHYYTSAHPVRGVGSWHARSKLATLGISCYSRTGCLAVTNVDGDEDDGELESFDPVGGAHGFHDRLLRARYGDQQTADFVTCAQGTCVAGYPDHWYQSAHPARYRSWHRIATPRFDVTCLTGHRSCVALRDAPFAGSAGPDLLVAATRRGPWKREAIDPGGEITGLACTSAKACVVVDVAGKLLVSTHPVAGRAAWHLSDTDQSGFDDVACQTVRSCVAVDNNGGVVVGRP